VFKDLTGSVCSKGVIFFLNGEPLRSTLTIVRPSS